MPSIANYGIEVIGDRISVHSPFSYKDRLKAINGSKWDNDIKAWTFPFTSAEQIDNIVSRFIIPRTPGFIELLSSIKNERKSSEVVRISTTLPDPEITKMPSWNHQKQAYHFAKSKNSAMLALDMGCVDGESIVTINRGRTHTGISRQMKLSDFHIKFHGGVLNTAKNSMKWEVGVPTFIRGLKISGEIGRVSVVDTYDRGEQECIQIITSDASIIVTHGHEMVTPNGKVRADFLTIGDIILTDYKNPRINRESPKQTKGIILDDGRRTDKNGYIRIYGVRHERESTSGVYEHILVAEKTLNRKLNSTEEVHHINHIRHDNRPENLQVLDIVSHKAEHNHVNNFGNFIPRHNIITNIIPVGIRHVYDITVEDDAHTFIANNVIVGNTGKTKVAIDILQNNNAERVLIVCPSHVIAVWPKEFEKHCVEVDDWEIACLDTGSTAKNVLFLKNKIDIARARKKKLVVIVNYEAIWRTELAKVVMSVFWDYVIADESHRIKSATGVASKFMAKLKIVSKKKLALTGTPMPHTPMDIFAQYRFLNDQIFGTSYTRFKRRYGKWGGFGGYQLLGFENEDELNSKFYSIAYKVGKEVLDLPEVMPHINVPVILEPDARKQYNSMLNDFLIWLNEDEAVTATNSLAKLLRLQQITSGFIPIPETEEVVEISHAKATALREVLLDLGQLEPVVIFCRFRRDLDTVHAVAKSLDRKSTELSGRMSSLALWQQSENIPILAVQIQAGGVGIDLTRARYCIYYSLGFSLGDYEQSLARVHRPGQSRPVQYIHLIAKNTVDETVYKALENKKEVVTEILREVRGKSIWDDVDLGPPDFDQEFDESYEDESDNED